MELLSKGNIQVSYTILVISHPNQRVCVRQHKRKKRLLSIYNRILTHREIYKINKTSNKNNNNTMEGRRYITTERVGNSGISGQFFGNYC